MTNAYMNAVLRLEILRKARGTDQIRLAAGLIEELQLVPAQLAVHAGAEGLQQRFLGGEAAGQEVGGMSFCR